MGARRQVDVSYQYRYDDNFIVFLDAQNILDEETRFFVRSPEMLFLVQDQGLVVRLGVQANLLDGGLLYF